MMLAFKSKKTKLPKAATAADTERKKMENKVITIENCTANAVQACEQREAEKPALAITWQDKLANFAARLFGKDFESTVYQLDLLHDRLHKLPDLAIEEKRIAQIEYGARLRTIDAWRDQEAAQLKREIIELQTRLEIMK